MKYTHDDGALVYRFETSLPPYEWLNIARGCYPWSVVEYLPTRYFDIILYKIYIYVILNLYLFKISRDTEHRPLSWEDSALARVGPRCFPTSFFGTIIVPYEVGNEFWLFS